MLFLRASSLKLASAWSLTVKIRDSLAGTGWCQRCRSTEGRLLQHWMSRWCLARMRFQGSRSQSGFFFLRHRFLQCGCPRRVGLSTSQEEKSLGNELIEKVGPSIDKVGPSSDTGFVLVKCWPLRTHEVRRAACPRFFIPGGGAKNWRQILFLLEQLFRR